MGDEMHQRNVAATALLGQALLPHLARIVPAPEPLGRLRSISLVMPQCFLNVAMAAAKVTMDTAVGLPGCTLVTAMARNGTAFGIRLSARLLVYGASANAPGPVLPGLQCHRCQSGYG